MEKITLKSKIIKKFLILNESNKFKIYITFQQKRICNFIQTLHCKRRKKNSKYIENPTRVIKDDETTSTFISIKKKKKINGKI